VVLEFQHIREDMLDVGEELRDEGLLLRHNLCTEFVVQRHVQAKLFAHKRRKSLDHQDGRVSARAECSNSKALHPDFFEVRLEQLHVLGRGPIGKVLEQSVESSGTHW
jgi:hypothetical protein